MATAEEAAPVPRLRADETLFRPVRAVNAFEETVERLLQAIKLGVVAPGERLPAERDLATRFAVSRVTLREAIRALQQAGYVESRRGRYGGTFICLEQPRPSRTSLRRVAARMRPSLDDALTFRQVVEAGAAAAAASRRLSTTECAHLRSCLAETAAADLPDYRRMDSRLHLAVAEVTGSATLTAAVAQTRMRVNELLDAIPLLERNIAHSNDQHDAVVRAILSSEVDAAYRLMVEHLEGTALLLRGFLS